jgi:hypothetical protein
MNLVIVISPYYFLTYCYNHIFGLICFISFKFRIFSDTLYPGFSEVDRFTYKASDGIAESNLATVSITVKTS